MERPGPEHDLAAVTELALTLELGPIWPEILKLAHHKSVRLSPLPIVARVQSSAPCEAAAGTMERELALARRLVGVGAPVVAPIQDPPPGPYVLGDCAVSLWSYVEHRLPRGEADAMGAAAALRMVHAALLEVGGDLPPFTDNVGRCGALLADLAALPTLSLTDRAFLRAHYERFRDQLAGLSFKSVPLHGDTHIGNVLFAAGGPIWADLETACLGPLEWDLVQLAPRTRALFGGVDPTLIDLLADLRSVTVAVWCCADGSRSAEMRAAAEHHLHRLRRRASINRPR
ncbi:MAG TPA: phosphotransferase [Caulobacteraceae bacterium]|nr:phosphotransferase [Caulobacteraceae bacterium]